MRAAKPFFMVLARDQRGVEEKVEELEGMRVPYVVVMDMVIGGSLQRRVLKSFKDKMYAVVYGTSKTS